MVVTTFAVGAPTVSDSVPGLAVISATLVAPGLSKVTFHGPPVSPVTLTLTMFVRASRTANASASQAMPPVVWPSKDSVKVPPSAVTETVCTSSLKSTLLTWTLAGLGVAVPTPVAGFGSVPSVVYQMAEPLSDEISIVDPASTSPVPGANVGSGGGVVSFTSHMPKSGPGVDWVMSATVVTRIRVVGSPFDPSGVVWVQPAGITIST